MKLMYVAMVQLNSGINQLDAKQKPCFSMAPQAYCLSQTVIEVPMKGNHITRNVMYTLQLWFHAMDFFSPLVIFRLGMSRLFM